MDGMRGEKKRPSAVHAVPLFQSRPFPSLAVFYHAAAQWISVSGPTTADSGQAQQLTVGRAGVKVHAGYVLL